MLFIPFLWYRQVIGHCKNVRVETSFDIRRLMSPPHLEKVYKNTDYTNADMYEKMLQVNVAESGVCEELMTPQSFEAQHRAWQRKATIVSGGLVVLIVLLIAYFVWSFVLDERERKRKLEEAEAKKKN